MNHAIIIFVALLFSPALWAQYSEPGSSPGGRPDWSLSARGGLVLGPADNQTTTHWDHDPGSSFQFQIGGFYNFPRAWKELYFFGGPELAYLYSYETLNSSSGNSALGTTMYQFLLTVGLAYEPSFLGGDWGAFVSTSGEIWGQKETRIDTSAFNRTVGSTKTDVPLSFSIGGYYRITEQWRPFINYESKISLTGHAGFGICSLGLIYGF